MAQGRIPWFNGTDPASWLSIMDDMFDEYQAPDGVRAQIASYYLTGPAELWVKNNSHMLSGWNWCAFSYQLLWEFDPSTKPPNLEEDEIDEVKSVVPENDGVGEEVRKSAESMANDIVQVAVQKELPVVADSDEDDLSISSPQLALVSLTSVESSFPLYRSSFDSLKVGNVIGSPYFDIRFSPIDHACKVLDEMLRTNMFSFCKVLLLDMRSLWDKAFPHCVQHFDTGWEVSEFAWDALLYFNSYTQRCLDGERQCLQYDDTGWWRTRSIMECEKAVKTENYRVQWPITSAAMAGTMWFTKALKSSAPRDIFQYASLHADHTYSNCLGRLVVSRWTLGSTRLKSSFDGREPWIVIHLMLKLLDGLVNVFHFCCDDGLPLHSSYLWNNSYAVRRSSTTVDIDGVEMETNKKMMFALELLVLYLVQWVPKSSQKFSTGSYALQNIHSYNIKGVTYLDYKFPFTGYIQKLWLWEKANWHVHWCVQVQDNVKKSVMRCSSDSSKDEDISTPIYNAGCSENALLVGYFYMVGWFQWVILSRDHYHYCDKLPVFLIYHGSPHQKADFSSPPTIISKLFLSDCYRQVFFQSGGRIILIDLLVLLSVVIPQQKDPRKYNLGHNCSQVHKTFYSMLFQGLRLPLKAHIHKELQKFHSASQRISVPSSQTTTNFQPMFIVYAQMVVLNIQSLSIRADKNTGTQQRSILTVSNSGCIFLFHRGPQVHSLRSTVYRRPGLVFRVSEELQLRHVSFYLMESSISFFLINWNNIFLSKEESRWSTVFYNVLVWWILRSASSNATNVNMGKQMNWRVFKVIRHISFIDTNSKQTELPGYRQYLELNYIAGGIVRVSLEYILVFPSILHITSLANLFPIAVVHITWQRTSGDMVIITLVIVFRRRGSWRFFAGVVADTVKIYSSLCIYKGIYGISGTIECDNIADTPIWKDRDKIVDLHQQVFLTTSQAYFPLLLDSEITDEELYMSASLSLFNLLAIHGIRSAARPYACEDIEKMYMAASTMVQFLVNKLQEVQKMSLLHPEMQDILCSVVCWDPGILCSVFSTNARASFFSFNSNSPVLNVGSTMERNVHNAIRNLVADPSNAKLSTKSYSMDSEPLPSVEFNRRTVICASSSNVLYDHTLAVRIVLGIEVVAISYTFLKGPFLGWVSSFTGLLVRDLPHPVRYGTLVDSLLHIAWNSLMPTLLLQLDIAYSSDPKCSRSSVLSPIISITWPILGFSVVKYYQLLLLFSDRILKGYPDDTIVHTLRGYSKTDGRVFDLFCYSVYITLADQQQDVSKLMLSLRTRMSSRGGHCHVPSYDKGPSPVKTYLHLVSRLCPIKVD